MSRITKIERESLPPDQRRFYDAVLAIRRRPISGPFIVITNASPDLAARYAHLGHYFHARGQADESIVSIRVRSFISLIGSRLLESPYEWAAWVNWALEAGVAQRTVDAIRRGEPPELDPEERLVNDFCVALATADHRVGDAQFEAAHSHFGSQRLVELVVTLGYFAMIAFPLNAFEMTMTASQMAQRKPFEPLGVRGKPWSGGASQREVLPPLVARTSSDRLPPLSRHEDVPPAHQHFLDRVVRSRGWISPLFGVLLHSADVAERIAHIGDYILYGSPLSEQTRSLVALITSRELDAPYAWAAAKHMAAESGLAASVASDIERGNGPRSGSDDQRLIATFCLQLLRANHHVADDVHARMIERFGTADAVQISALAGYVAMTSIIATAFDIAAPEDCTKPLL